MKTGARSGYWVVEWADGFDPSLSELVAKLPEAVLGRRVAIASCDSGPYRPSRAEINLGWTVEGTLAISPPIESIAELPTPGFDEWYVYEDDVPPEIHKSFVNRFGFAPLDAACAQASEFWEQVELLRPLHVLGAGTPTMFLVTRDESLRARAERV